MELSTQQQMLVEQRLTNEKKSTGAAYLLWFFLSAFSAHRLYLGKTGSAVAQIVLFWGGCLLAGVIIGMDKLEDGSNKEFLIDWMITIATFGQDPKATWPIALRIADLAARDRSWGVAGHRAGAALELALLFKRTSREAEVTQLWNHFRSDSVKNQTDWQIGALAILGNDLEHGRMLLRRAQSLKSVSENDRAWLAWVLELPDQEFQAEISGLFAPSEPTPLGEETEIAE
jgi:hypothetical protein